MQSAQVWYLRKELYGNSAISNLFTIEYKLQSHIDSQDYLQFYHQIGKPWKWAERLILDQKKLDYILQNPLNEIYYIFENQERIGYFEIDFNQQEPELQYFGIIPKHLGKGIGKQMMQAVFNIVLQRDQSSIFLHTCSNDSPAALPFYQKMGFIIYKEVTENQKIIVY